MTDFLLAAAHHLAVFALVVVLGVEMALMRPGLTGDQVKRLAVVDRAYGALAALVVVAGVLRVVFGDVGWAYYVGNWVFWAKMALFALIGGISVWPTVAILNWRRRVTDDPDFAPERGEVLRLRRLIHIEASLLLLIPVAAAAMARGIGL